MKNPLILTLSVLSLLTACGGSGGDGDDGDNGNPPAAGMNITSANAVLVTQVTYQAALAGAALGDITSGTGLLTSGPSGVSKIDGSFATAGEAGNTSMNVPIPPTVDNCIPSGTMTISGEIADPFTPTLTPGDFFDVIFDMCDDGFSVTHGDLHYDVTAFTGDFFGGVYGVTMAAILNDFQVATAQDVLTSNGDATIRLNTLLTSAISVEVGGQSLTTDANASSTIQTNFSSAQTVNADDPALPYTTTTSGTLDSTELAGVVSYSTPTMFEGFGVDYPDTGVFLVSATNSSARMTALDNVNVRIDIDNNGDGTVDETINTTWAELDGV